MIIFSLNNDSKLKINHNLLKDLFKELDNVVSLKSSKNIVEITFISNSKMKKLNKSYRNKDSTTDVLSFPYNNSNKVIEILGEIFISLPVAKLQAQKYCHSLEREICFLITHGFLHLCGFDHDKTAEEVKMLAIQNKILNNLKLNRKQD